MPQSPQTREKLLHQRLAFGCQHPARNRCPGMQQGCAYAHKTPFRIIGSIDYAVDLTPCQSPCTHHAWLYGDVYRTPLQILPAEGRCCRSDTLHLGMGRSVAQRLHKVMTASYHRIAANDDGTDRYLLTFQRFASLVYCHAHELLVALFSFFVSFHKYLRN